MLDQSGTMCPATPHYIIDGQALHLTDIIEISDERAEGGRITGVVMAFHGTSGWPVVFFGAHCARVPGQVNPNLIRRILPAETPEGSAETAG